MIIGPSFTDAFSFPAIVGRDIITTYAITNLLAVLYYSNWEHTKRFLYLNSVGGGLPTLILATVGLPFDFFSHQTTSALRRFFILLSLSVGLHAAILVAK
jgi:uncharacterized membrane protein